MAKTNRKAYKAQNCLVARVLLDGVVDRTTGEVLCEGFLHRRQLSRSEKIPFANPIAKIYNEFVDPSLDAKKLGWVKKSVRAWIYGFLDVCIGIQNKSIKQHRHWERCNSDLCYEVSKTTFRKLHGNIAIHQQMWDFAEQIGLCEWRWTGSNLQEHMGNSALLVNPRFLLNFSRICSDLTQAVNVAQIREMVSADDLEPYSDEDIMALSAKYGSRLHTFTLSPIASRSIFDRAEDMVSDLFRLSNQERNGLIGMMRTRNEYNQIITLYKEGRCRMSSVVVKQGDMGFTSMKKTIRSEILRNFDEYDIQAAAPSIMYFKAIEDMPTEVVHEKIPLLTEFVKNPSEFRQWFEEQTGIPAKELKALLNRALFARNLNVKTRYHTEVFMFECKLTGRGHYYQKTDKGIVSKSPIHALLNELYYARNRLIRRARAQQDSELQGLIKRFQTEYGNETDIRAAEKAAKGRAKWLGFKEGDRSYERVYKAALKQIIRDRMSAKRPRYSFTIENDMGVQRDLERWKKSSALAHIIFGAETAMMMKVREFVRQQTGEELIHVHDAFFVHESVKVSIPDLEEYIEKETGMKLRFSIKS